MIKTGKFLFFYQQTLFKFFPFKKQLLLQLLKKFRGHLTSVKGSETYKICFIARRLFFFL